MTTFPPYLEQTAEQYKLNDWVANVDERGKKYFSGIDSFKSEIKAITNSAPSEEQIIGYLVLVLGGDRTFTGYIKKWKGSSALIEEKFWEQLYKAAAYVLLTAYAESSERNEWPEQP
jgi:hypothetical protein